MGFLQTIRKWALRDKVPLREIARRTGLSRNTIRRYLREGVVEPKFKTPARSSKLDPYADRLAARLSTRMRTPRKDRESIKAIYEYLVGLGYDGSYSKSLEELKQLRKNIDAAIENYEVRKLAEARAKLEAMAAEMGVKLEDVVGGSGKGKGKSQGVPKYRHPENPALTWTGRGRQPEWFKEALANGTSADDLKI